MFVIAVGIVALPFGACTDIDNFLASIPIFSFMHESPAFDPYEAPRPAPPRSVPFATPTGIALPPLPRTPTEAYLREFGQEIGPNPLPATDSTIAAGQMYYLRLCAVCHGPTGTGDGTAVGPGLFPFAPDITLDRVAQRPDGYIYGIIRAGRGLMPPYAAQTTHRQRWLIVTYVRQLQEQAQAAAAESTARFVGDQ